MQKNKKNVKQRQAKPVTKASKEFAIPKWAPFALILVTALIYARAIFNDFATLDDDTYVLENPFIKSLSWESIKTIFTSFYFANYHPLTTLTYLFEYILYGANPLPYHLLNVILHLVNVWLVYKLAEKLSGKSITAIVVSALFALHPMHVESVAWISERKDVLYTCFYLLSLLVYLKYLASGYKAKLYIGAIFLFILSLFSKSAAVTLPVLLIAVDIYKGRKINLKLILEKVPFLLLSVLFGVLAIMSQHSGKAINEVSTYYSFFDRIFLFFYGIAFYIVKLVASFDLCVMHYYPDRMDGVLPWHYYASLPFVLVLGWLVIRKTSFRKEMLFGAGFFIIAISVMMQIIAVGPAITAERYTYVSYIGLFYIAGQWFSDSMKTRMKNAAIVIFSLFAIMFAAQTWLRIGVWKNGETLLMDVIKKNPDNYVAYWIRANMYNNKGDLQAALKNYDKTLECKPDYLLCIKARGDVRNKLKDFKGALEDLNRAISMDSADVEAYNNRGKAYYGLGDMKSALNDCNKALRMNPANATAYNNRSLLRAQAGDLKGGLDDINKSLKFSPSNSEAYTTRANIKLLMEDYDGSVADYNFSLTLKPGVGSVYFNRGFAKMKKNDLAGACKDWEKAQELGFEQAAQVKAQYCSK